MVLSVSNGPGPGKNLDLLNKIVVLLARLRTAGRQGNPNLIKAVVLFQLITIYKYIADACKLY